MSRKDDLFGVSAARDMRSLLDNVGLGGATANVVTSLTDGLRRYRSPLENLAGPSAMAKLHTFEDWSAAAQLKALGIPMSLDVTRTLASLASARELATPTAFDLTQTRTSLASSSIRELAMSVGTLKAATSSSSTMALGPALEEHASYLAKLHASPLGELVGSIKATDIMGRMPAGMGGTFDRLASVRSLIEPANAPLGRVGLFSFVDTSPALALASLEDSERCELAALREGGAAEETTDDDAELEVQVVIHCSECGDIIVPEGITLTGLWPRLQLEAGVALCPTCVGDDSLLLALPALYSIEGDEQGDGKPRGRLRLVRRPL
jgi:hypothetical protein